MWARLAWQSGGLLLRRCPPLPAAAVSPVAAAAARLASGDAIDRSRFPRLDERDLEERFVRGNGPGGQSVSKTANCVSLKHVPTGLVVKNHESRSLETNRRVARRLLAERLDRLLNGQDSVAAQLERSQQQRSQRSQDQRRRRRDRKQQWRTQRDAAQPSPSLLREDQSRSEDSGPQPP